MTTCGTCREWILRCLTARPSASSPPSPRLTNPVAPAFPPHFLHTLLRKGRVLSDCASGCANFVGGNGGRGGSAGSGGEEGEEVRTLLRAHRNLGRPVLPVLHTANTRFITSASFISASGALSRLRLRMNARSTPHRCAMRGVVPRAEPSASSSSDRTCHRRDRRRVTTPPPLDAPRHLVPLRSVPRHDLSRDRCVVIDRQVEQFCRCTAGKLRQRFAHEVAPQ